MADMTEFSGKKEFPSQVENRRQWIIDVVRENQVDIAEILWDMQDKDGDYAADILCRMKPMDRDAILQPNGILTPEQIELLK